jgi:hypothetical protein
MFNSSKRPSSPFGGLRTVVAGGSEAYLVARELAENNIPVILTPPRSMPGSWDRRHSAGAPYTAHHAALLASAGVKVGLGVADDSFAGQLRWEAGFVLEQSRGFTGLHVNNTDPSPPLISLSDDEVIGMITWNIADIFSLSGAPRPSVLPDDDIGRIRVGRKPHFVGFNGNPLRQDSKIEFVISHNGIRCKPPLDIVAY